MSRIWRERTLTSAAYRIEPRFWTQVGFQFAEGLPDWQRRAAKNFEPRVTGMAWTSGRLYLVIATVTAAYEQVARLMHARALLRADPDYCEHRGKRVSMVLLADKVDPSIADFCRRQRVRIVTQCEQLSCATDTKRTPINPPRPRPSRQKPRKLCLRRDSIGGAEGI